MKRRTFRLVLAAILIAGAAALVLFARGPHRAWLAAFGIAMILVFMPLGVR